jgi:hypothetical protein
MVYNETQKLSQPWIWIVAIISGLLAIGLSGAGVYEQIIQGQKSGIYPMSEDRLIFVFILLLILFISIYLLLVFSKLTTIIDKNAINYKYFPFHLKFRSISWNEIEQYDVITYNPIKDYGGWGIRFGKKGKAYNVSGNKGLLLYLKTGKRILIGTKKDIELADFLSRINTGARTINNSSNNT